MRYNLIQYTENLYANYWVVPFTLSVSAIILAFGLSEIGTSLNQSILFRIKYEQAMSILTVVASATATMASVVLSITVLILSIASSQLGPRLLPNFMRQGRTQIIMGILLGSFVYTLFGMLILSQRAQTYDQVFLITIFGVILGALCFFTIIYFVHYVCHVIQIDNIIVFLGDDLSHSIKRTFNRRENEQRNNEIKPVRIPNTELYLTTEVKSKKSGYIQLLDYTKCLRIAENNNCIIEIKFRPGHYLWQGQICFLIKHSHPINNAKIQNQLNSSLTLGIRRTTIQDVEFAFEQLAEIAIRALSPSMANPFTAINCADRLAFAINYLNNFAQNPDKLFDEENNLRLIINSFEFKGIVNIAFDRLRQQANTDLMVSIRILQIFHDLLNIGMQQCIADTLYQQAKAIFEGINKNSLSIKDQDELATSFERVKKVYFNQ